MGNSCGHLQCSPRCRHRREHVGYVSMCGGWRASNHVCFRARTPPWRALSAVASCGLPRTHSWNYTGLPPAVSRQLGHLLDHSTLPVACSREPSFAHLTPDQLLPMSSPLLPVMFPTPATWLNGDRAISRPKRLLFASTPHFGLCQILLCWPCVLNSMSRGSASL
jgi:hypothetical protein